jgi:hypothetical protein
MKSRRAHRKQRGSGYTTSQQFFDPSIRPPMAYPFAAAPSTAPTAYEIRPVLASTFQTAGGRRTRRVQRAGFSPSIMGGFIPNAQAAIVPAVLYGAYHFLVPKTSGTRRKSGNSRNSRNSRNRKN